MLFKALDLNYIKLVPEDVEGHTMQWRFGMPVLLSAYPQSMVSSKFFHDQMPAKSSSTYRTQFLM